MNQPCVNSWCPSKVEREGRKCGPCIRSEERTERLVARVDEKAKQRSAAIGAPRGDA